MKPKLSKHLDIIFGLYNIKKSKIVQDESDGLLIYHGDLIIYNKLIVGLAEGLRNSKKLKEF